MELPTVLFKIKGSQNAPLEAKLNSSREFLGISQLNMELVIVL